MPAFDKERNILFLLLFVYLLTKVPLLFTSPLVLDEALYAVNIQEELKHPTPIPVYLNQQVGWKPPLFFFVYAPFVLLFQNFFPLEITFRLPTLVFGLINVMLLYFMIKKLYDKIELAFYTALIFSGFYLTSFVNTSVLVDTLTLTFILSALYCYVNTSWGNHRYAAAVIFTFLAFFTKLWVAAIIPVLALAWAFTHSKQMLGSRYFLISLSSLFFAALSYSVYVDTFATHGIFQDVSVGYTLTKRIFGLPELLQSVIIGTITPLFGMLSVWLGFTVIGLWKTWKQYKFVFFWLLLTIFPLISGYFMPWYFLPVLPAFAFFSAQLFLTDKKETGYFDIICCLLVISMGMVIGFFYHHNTGDAYEFAQKEAGEFLAFKENVLVIGNYAPTVVAYKTITEIKHSGDYLDFGWIIPGSDNEDIIRAYIEDYNTTKFNATTNIMNAMPPAHDPPVYKKTSLISKFKYVVLVGFENVSTSGSLIYNKSGVRIYER